MSLDDGIRQGIGHAKQIGTAGSVLEARERRLGRQRLAMHRIPTDRELVERIVRQLPCVVPIGIAQRDGEDPLPHQLDLLVRHLPRLTRVSEAPGQRLRQSQALVDRLQEQRPAV